MKLKAKREARDIVPSEFALKVPDMEKRNDSLLKQPHNVVLPNNTLQTYSMTDGAYIKKHTDNNLEHTVPNFTPKLLQLIKKSSPSSNEPTYDEPPVGGGMESVSGSEGMSVAGGVAEAPAKAPAKAPAEEGSFQKRLDELTILKIEPLPLSEDAGKRQVWFPVGNAYKELDMPIVLESDNRGTTVILMGKPTSKWTEETVEDDVDSLPALKELVDDLILLRGKLSGAFAKRVKGDTKKIVTIIQRLDSEYKVKRDSEKKPESPKAGAGAGIAEAKPITVVGLEREAEAKASAGAGKGRQGKRTNQPKGKTITVYV